MAKFPIVCPKCHQTFSVSSALQRGTCPHCTAPLIYDRVPSELPEQPLEPQLQPHQGQHIDITAVKEAVDSTLKDKSIGIHSPHIQDIAVISTLPPPKKYSQIKTIVTTLLHTKD